MGRASLSRCLTTSTKGSRRWGFGGRSSKAERGGLTIFGILLIVGVVVVVAVALLMFLPSLFQQTTPGGGGTTPSTGGGETSGGGTGTGEGGTSGGGEGSGGGGAGEGGTGTGEGTGGAGEAGGEESLPVVEEESEVVGPGGGTVTLSDGMTVEFTSSALPESAEVTVKKVDLSSIDPIGNKYCYDIDVSGAQLQGTVRLYLPYDESKIPEGASEEDVYVVYYNEETGEMTVVEDAVVDTVNNRVIVETNHLSRFIVVWPVYTSTPTVQSRILEVPYYDQGDTGYCWAACIAMLIKYYKGFQAPSVWEVAKFFNLGPDEGLLGLRFYFSATLKTLVHMKLGVSPSRGFWSPRLSNGLKNYLIKQVVQEGRPVMLILTSEGHAVVVVGYDGSNFVIHDPANGMYIKRSWDDIRSKADLRVVYYTMVIPLPTPSNPVLVTSNIESYSSQEVKGLCFFYSETSYPEEAVSSRVEGTEIGFQWDGTKPDGYYFAGFTTTKVKLDRIPDDTWMCLKVQLANSGSTSRTVELLYDLVDEDTGEYIGVDREHVTIPPKTIMEFSFEPKKLSEISEQGCDHIRLTLYVSDEADNMLDFYMITFQLSEWSEATSIKHYPATPLVATMDDFGYSVSYGEYGEKTQSEVSGFLYGSYVLKFFPGSDQKDFIPEPPDQPQELEEVELSNTIYLGTWRSKYPLSASDLDSIASRIDSWISSSITSGSTSSSGVTISVYFTGFTYSDVTVRECPGKMLTGTLTISVTTPTGTYDYDYYLTIVVWAHDMGISIAQTRQLTTPVTNPPASPPSALDLANNLQDHLDLYEITQPP